MTLRYCRLALSFSITWLLICIGPREAKAQSGDAPPLSTRNALHTDLYGDPLPIGVQARLGTLRFRSVGQTFALSADGKLIALTGDSARLCAIPSGQALCRLTAAAEDKVVGVLLSPDNKTCAVFGKRSQSLYDVATGKRLWVKHADKNVDDAEPGGTFTADSRNFLSWGLDHFAYLRETATGKVLRKIPSSPLASPWRIAASADGKTFAGLIDANAIGVWDVETGRRIHALARQDLPVYWLVMSPDGTTLASLSEEWKTIRLWTVAKGTEVRITPSWPVWPIGLRFSPDGKYLTSLNGSSYTKLSIWDVRTGKAVRHFRHELTANAFAFSPDCKSIAIHRRPHRTAQVMHRGFSPMVAVLFSPDAYNILDDDPCIEIFDILTGQRQHRLPGHVAPCGTMQFSSSGRTLVAHEGQAIRFWDLATETELPGPEGHIDTIALLTFAANGSAVATAGDDGSVRVWDPATGKPMRRWPGRSDTVGALALSPDARVVATFRSDDSKVRLLDVATGRELHALPPEPDDPLSIPLAFTGDGRLLAVSSHPSSVVRLIDVLTGKVRVSLDARATVEHLAASPDGQTLAISTAKDAGATDPDADAAYQDTVGLWDVTSERPRLRSLLRGSGTPAFSPDGRLLVTAEEQTIRLWEVVTGALIHKFERPDNFVAAACTRDGRVLALAAHAKKVSQDFSNRAILRAMVWPVFAAKPLASRAGLWDVLNGKRIQQFQVPGEDFASLALSADGATLAAAMFDTTALTWSLTGLREATYSERLTRKDLEQLWRQLAGMDAGRAFQALYTLRRAPATAVPFLRGTIRPAADSKNVPAFIADLGAERFATRQAAAQALARLDLLAEPALRATLRQNLALEVRRRIEGLLDKLDTAPPPAELLGPLRAVQLLEMIATPEAVQVLEGLARGAPNARLTREARGSLRRLAERQAFP
jgi:WD40 repeat protein